MVSKFRIYGFLGHGSLENVLFFLIEVYLIYNIMLVSNIQQSDSIIHIDIYIPIFFSLDTFIVYYKILIIVPCAMQ